MVSDYTVLKISNPAVTITGDSDDLLVTNNNNPERVLLLGTPGPTGPIGPAGPIASAGLTMPSIFNVTGSPINTTTGTFTVTLATGNQNLVFATPATGPGTPSFRSLQTSDLPTIVGASGIQVTTTSTSYTITASGLGTLNSVALSMPSEYSVAGSPITGSSGTFTVTKASQSANKGYLSPDGSAGAPSFRSMVPNDIPFINSGTNIEVVYNNPNNITISASGAVSSVALSMPTDVFDVSGSPITEGSGTITVTFDNQNPNLAFMGPISGGAAAPAFRGITGPDLTTIRGASGIQVHQTAGNTLTVSCSSLFEGDNRPRFDANQLVGVNDSRTLYEGITVTGASGIQVTHSGATLIISASSLGNGSGSVTSVNYDPTEEFKVSGVPITSSGTITLSKVTQDPNTFWAGPASSLGFFTYAATCNGPNASGPFNYLTTGPDNNIWYISTTSGGNHYVAKYTPDSNSTTFYGTLTFPARDICTGPDGNLWITTSTDTNSNIVAKVTTTGTITQYTTTAGTEPHGICAGPDGNLWFTCKNSGQIGKVTTSGTFTLYSLPSGTSSPRGICLGPDNNLWFCELNANKIGKIDTSGSITEYSLPNASSEPKRIVAGPDGNLWFTEYNGNRIGKITTAGVITEYTIPTSSSQPLGICVGPDNQIWFTEKNADKIGRINPTTGVIEEFTPGLVGSTQLEGITVGPDNHIWAIDSNPDRLVKFVHTDEPIFRSIRGSDLGCILSTSPISITQGASGHTLIIGASFVGTGGTTVTYGSSAVTINSPVIPAFQARLTIGDSFTAANKPWSPASDDDGTGGDNAVALAGYGGNNVSLYNTLNNEWYTIKCPNIGANNNNILAELLLQGAASGNIVYDVFAYNSGTISSPTLALAASAWYSQAATNSPAAGTNVDINLSSASTNFEVGDWVTIQGSISGGLATEVQRANAVTGTKITVDTLSNTYTSPPLVFNNRTRATDLTYQDSILVSSSNSAHRYVGTIRTSNTDPDINNALVEDNPGKRHIWNYYNRIPRPFFAQDPSNSWVLSSAAGTRASNANTTEGQGRVSFVTGFGGNVDDTSETVIDITFHQGFTTGDTILAGIGLNSITTASIWSLTLPNSADVHSNTVPYSFRPPHQGFNFIQCLERSGGSTTVYGDGGESVSSNRSWLTGWIMA